MRLSTLILLLFISSSVFSQKTTLYIYVGEGTLVTKNLKNYYRVAQFRNLASTPEEVKKVLERQCTKEKACVGFHLNATRSSGRYLAGALLFEASMVSWPYSMPNDWAKRGVKKSWYSDGSQARINDTWSGTGAPSLYNASVSVDKGWNTWKAYAKIFKIMESNNGKKKKKGEKKKGKKKKK